MKTKRLVVFATNYDLRFVFTEFEVNERAADQLRPAGEGIILCWLSRPPSRHKFHYPTLSFGKWVEIMADANTRLFLSLAGTSSGRMWRQFAERGHAASMKYLCKRPRRRKTWRATCTIS